MLSSINWEGRYQTKFYLSPNYGSEKKILSVTFFRQFLLPQSPDREATSIASEFSSDEVRKKIMKNKLLVFCLLIFLMKTVRGQGPCDATNWGWGQLNISETAQPPEQTGRTPANPNYACKLTTTRHGRVSSLFYYPGIEHTRVFGSTTRLSSSSFIRGWSGSFELAARPT